MAAYTRWGVGWGSDNSDYSGVTLYVRVCMPLCVRVYVCMRDSGDRQGQAGGRETGKARHGKGNEGRARQARHGQGKQERQASGTTGKSRRHKGQSIGP
jgi:hypothetical protein